MRISIRPLKVEDAYTSYKWRNDPEVFKYTGTVYSNEITLETELNWIKNVIAKEDDYRCAIIVDGIYVGNIYITNIKDGEGEYHIFIGNKEYWGKGIATEVSKLIIQYAFECLRLKSIFLNVRKENAVAIKLYNNLGFTIEKEDDFITMRLLASKNYLKIYPEIKINMKILFISNGQSMDYQCDIVFHGLKMLYGKNVYETSDNWFMFNDISEKQKAKLYGKGFTITGLLDSKLKNVITNYEIHEKIKNTFFDLIIYGSIHCCQDFFCSVSLFYPKEKIIVIDGEDDTIIRNFFVGKALYFKRELHNSYRGVFPISFGIPKEKLISEIKRKEKILAHIIPGDISTYIYENEKDYYNDYAISYFGKSIKKAGWDCLRHYEIMANGCIPYFPDLLQCPKETMTSFPKRIVLETNDIFDKISQQSADIDGELLRKYCKEILTFTRQYLTTEKIAEYLINTALNQKINKIDNKIKLWMQWFLYRSKKVAVRFLRRIA